MLWLCSLFNLFLVYHALTDKELDLFEQTSVQRKVLIVNHKLTNEFSIIKSYPGVLKFATNAKPGYIKPSILSRPKAKDFLLTVNRKPVLRVGSPGCLPVQHPIGITVLGTLIYSVTLPEPGCPQADLREDLPSTKFDKCGGYVEKTDKVYRVYQFSSCIANITCNQPSQIIGIALDGFPIYGPIDEDGKQLTSRELDECHGRFTALGEYRYHATKDFPYFISCFRGELHREAGIPLPVPCSCPFNDTIFFPEKQLPFAEYTIGYEWRTVYRNVSLYPCKRCTTEIGKKRFLSNPDEWRLRHNDPNQKKSCYTETKYRFIYTTQRRLSPGRLPPDLEIKNWERDQRIKMNQASQNNYYDTGLIEPEISNEVEADEEKSSSGLNIVVQSMYICIVFVLLTLL